MKALQLLYSNKAFCKLIELNWINSISVKVAFNHSL